MSERRRCHYFGRGETWHEETFNVKHLCIQQCLTMLDIGQPTMDHENVH